MDRKVFKGFWKYCWGFRKTDAYPCDLQLRIRHERHKLGLKMWIHNKLQCIQMVKQTKQTEQTNMSSQTSIETFLTTHAAELLMHRFSMFQTDFHVTDVVKFIPA